MGQFNSEKVSIARRVSPADEGAVELSRSFPGLRKSEVQFDKLLAILEPHIKKKTTNFHNLIDPEQQLAVR